MVAGGCVGGGGGAVVAGCVVAGAVVSATVVGTVSGTVTGTVVSIALVGAAVEVDAAPALSMVVPQADMATTPLITTAQMADTERTERARRTRRRFDATGVLMAAACAHDFLGDRVRRGVSAVVRAPPRDTPWHPVEGPTHLCTLELSTEGSPRMHDPRHRCSPRRLSRRAAIAALVLVVGACAVERGAGRTVEGQHPLTRDSTWQWQLQGDLDTSYDVDVYDVDLFDTPEATVDTLRAAGRVVVCYFSAGSFESWRDDAGTFATSALGDLLDGYDDERWLDVRDSSVRTVALARLDLAVTKGCDGVEPDNVDGYTNGTGFALTDDDQLAFNRFLADAAHERGLSVGLKNDVDQIPELAEQFDFAVNEQCHEFDECGAYEPFLRQDKPVFNAEYAASFFADPGVVCGSARELGVRTLLLPLELDDSSRVSCDG